MSDLNTLVEKQRAKFREKFKFSVKEVQNLADSIKPEGVSDDIFSKFAEGSGGRKWQVEFLNILENKVSRDIYLKFQEVLAERKGYRCSGCATCCNLACSEFSPDELKRRADGGDNFARQFLSVFIPYKSKEEARMVYPEYIALLEENKEEDVYFYHCPKLTEDKRCSDYENRPQICRDFPDNPLCILPSSCGFCGWREKTEDTVLLLHAMIEVVEYYKDKISVNL